MRFQKFIVLFAIGSVVTAGCGGGNESTAAPIDISTTFAFGELDGRAAISNPPVTTTTSDVTATGFSGVFSSLRLRELNPSINETRIVASSQMSGNYNLVSFAIDGSDIQKLTNNTDFYPSFSTNGKMVFSRLFGQDQAMLANSDGSGAVQVTTNGAGVTSMSYAGDKFAFYDGLTGAVKVMNTSTLAITPVVEPPHTSASGLAMSPDGKYIYVVYNVSGTNTLYKTNSDGISAPVQMIGSMVISNDLSVSPDGSEVAFQIPGAPNKIGRVGTGYTTALGASVTLPGTGIFGFAYSPDGKEFVASCQMGGGYQLVRVNIAAGDYRIITQDTTDNITPRWTPFIKERTLISGGGGLLGTRACAVIYGQQGSNTTSAVAVDVTTPSSVVLTAQTPPFSYSPNLVFSVDADTITKLSYTNGYAWRGIRAVGSSTPVLTANGALVSIDGASGAVVSVLPFSGTRALGSAPKVTDQGSVRVFTGSFLSVMDKDGKNVAPNGANVVKLDTKTNTMTVE